MTSKCVHGDGVTDLLIDNLRTSFLWTAFNIIEVLFDAFFFFVRKFITFVCVTKTLDLYVHVYVLYFDLA